MTTSSQVYKLKKTLETLKFDNLILEDSDNEKPKAAEDGQVNDVNNDGTELTSGNVGGNSGNTRYEMGSISYQSSGSGGANEGSTSRTQTRQQ